MRRGAAFAALAVLGLGGCGGSSSLTADQLRARATVLCNLASVQTDRITTPSAPADTGRFLRQGIALIEPELQQLRKLHAPQDIASVYATGTGGMGQELAALRAARASIERGDNAVTATKALGQKLAPLRIEVDGAWRALQIPACLSR
jgi:hypothetical protein